MSVVPDPDARSLRPLPEPVTRFRSLLAGNELVVAPGCSDALSARLIERAGFPAAFMSGFAVAAARSALPDTGLLSYAEVLDQGRGICESVSIPVIGDADTGYGNETNVRRTVAGFARAGFACVMIEDQVAPKRCGHTAGKQTVGRDEAARRFRAAVDARDEGADVVLLARTDARATDGLDEAIARSRMFFDLGADLVFVEAPLDETEMARICAEGGGPQLVNLVEGGATPIPGNARLVELGYRVAIRPLTLQLAAVAAMETALAALAEREGNDGEAGSGSDHGLPPLAAFDHLRAIVDFDAHLAIADRYRA